MKIYGYRFAVIVERGEERFVASCPGIGGIFEEGETVQEALQNAMNTAKFVLDLRKKKGYELTENNEFLEIIREPVSVDRSIKPKLKAPITDIYNSYYIPCGC